MLYIFGGLGMLIAIFILQIPTLGYKDEADALKIFFFIHPGYAFAQVRCGTCCLFFSFFTACLQAIYDIYLNYYYHEVCYASDGAYASCKKLGYLPAGYASTTSPGMLH